MAIRIANTAGDSILMEFASTIEALRCAIAIHQGMRTRNEAQPPERRLMFRMGVNVGDVVSHGDDILGDGVNVAARLEGLAAPGGIVVSRSARDQIEGRLDVPLDALGAVEVKNISRPIEAYRVLIDTEVQAAPAAARAKRPRFMFAALAAVVLIAAVAAWQFLRNDFETASVGAMAYPLPDKPSIVVLPFSAASDDPEEALFADGITEDLITDLSKLSDLFVIARNSSFALKDSELRLGEIAERFGVRYVLSGGLRRAGDTLRINANLIDATTGRSVWADRFDGPVADIFAAQDAFILKVVSALEVKLTTSEAAQIQEVDTTEIAARTAFQLGWDLYSRFNAVDNARAVPHFEKALELDPDYGRAYAALALVKLRAAVFNGWEVPMNRSFTLLYHDDVPRLLEEASARGSSLVHVVESLQHLNYRDTTTASEGANRGTDDARLAAATAIAKQPNDPEAQIMMAWALIAAGETADGLVFAEMAMRLDPAHPAHYAMVAAAGLFALDRLDEAVALLERSLEASPKARELLPMLASLKAQRGEREGAHAALAKWTTASSTADYLKVINAYRFPISWVDVDMDSKLLDGLRLAALPPGDAPDDLVARLEAGAENKVAIIRALGWFGPMAETSVDALITALSDDKPLVRREAAVALGKIGPKAKAALPELRSLTDLPIVSFHAEKAIAKIEAAE